MYKEIDENGYFVADVLDINLSELSEEEQARYVLEVCPNGLRRPKWNGTAWVEGATAEYIAELNKTVITPPTPDEIRIKELEQKNELLEECIAEMAVHVFN